VPGNHPIMRLELISNGEVRIDGGVALKPQQLGLTLDTLARAHTCPNVQFQVQKTTRYRDVYAIMEVFQKHGCAYLGFTGEETSTPTKP
jgi:biopolymer transport protein ExbD